MRRSRIAHVLALALAAGAMVACTPGEDPPRDPTSAAPTTSDAPTPPTVAALLRTTCPTRATVAPLGGDELAVLLPCAPSSELREVLDRFHDAVRTSPMNHLGRVLALSVSVGGAHSTASRESDLATLYAEADEALYQAKLRGRGRVVTV